MSSPLPFGIALPNHGPLANAESFVRLARRAESRGVDSVWVSDHLVAPVQVGSLYPYDRRKEPKPGMGVIEEFYEPLTTLAFVAGATQRIRLGVSVYVMPYRNPVVTAKMVGTLDALSGGRVLFGVGVGWLREEFAALGQDARSRGRTTDEYLEVCRRLWRDDVAEFTGEHYVLPAVRAAPKPRQRPWPPIWIGGNSNAARQRAVRLGDGLHLIDVAPDDAAERVARVREDLARAGRDAAPFTVSVRTGIAVREQAGIDERPLQGTPEKIRRDAGAYAAAGVDYLVLNLLNAGSIEALESALDATVDALMS